jgi:endonuclease/exonuclease/phosphatase family metal-dependent hydrolase
MKHNIKVILKIVLIIVNALAALALIFTGYSGCISPDTMPLANSAGLTFPVWLVLIIVCLIVDAVLYRKLVAVPVVAMLVTISPILNYSPLNFFHHTLTEEEKANSFKLLSYNVYNFCAYDEKYPGDVNPTISYILAEDADVVSLQEAEIFSPMPQFHITQEQIDSLKERYPYRSIIGRNAALSVFSKYPITHVDLHEDSMSVNHREGMRGWEIDIKGHKVLLLNVHLQSIGLSDEDKELYQEITDFKDKKLTGLRSSLLSKLSIANVARAAQAERLRVKIDSIGDENVIVAGDFNDIQGCYSMRTISDGKMKQAYRECALGPTITYHSNRFYFRIDHILYQGKLKATELKKGKLKSSDHYPQTVTFVFE